MYSASRNVYEGTYRAHRSFATAGEFNPPLGHVKRLVPIVTVWWRARPFETRLECDLQVLRICLRSKDGNLCADDIQGGASIARFKDERLWTHGLALLYDPTGSCLSQLQQSLVFQSSDWPAGP